MTKKTLFVMSFVCIQVMHVIVLTALKYNNTIICFKAMFKYKKQC